MTVNFLLNVMVIYALLNKETELVESYSYLNYI